MARVHRSLTAQQIHDIGKAWNDAVEGKPLPFITDEQLESKYPALKELGDKYRAELEKYRSWEKLK
jgi:hypothetical protein